MAKRIYTEPLLAAQQRRSEGTSRRDTAKQGVLGTGPPATEAISVQPGERRIEGRHAGLRADMMAAQLEELFNAGGIETVPIFDTGADTKQDGYYTLEEHIDEADPRAPDRWRTFVGSIARVGSRRTHWRSVATTLTPITTENPYADASTVLIGAPAAATKPRWYEGIDGGRTEAPTIDTTRTGEHAAIDLFDVTEPAFADPTLVYYLGYSNHGPVDCRVWDTRGNATKTDGNGDVEWQKVYDPGHEFRGVPIVESGRLRLTFDESATLTAERWDPGTNSYSGVGLPGGLGWVLSDLDLVRIAPGEIEASVLLEEDSGELYTIDMLLPRGYDNAIWTRPAGTGDRTVFEDFSATDVSNYGGDTSAFSTGGTTGPAPIDRGLAGLSNAGGDSNSIASTSGLANYPDRDDGVWRVWMQQRDGPQETAFCWFAQSETSHPDGYWVYHDLPEDEVRVELRQGGSNTTLATTGFGGADLTNDEWERADIQYRNGDYVVTSVDTDGNVLASLSIASETTFTSGGIGFRVVGRGSEGNSRWQYVHNPVPGGIFRWLEPIATGVAQDPGTVVDVTAREEVRP